VAPLASPRLPLLTRSLPALALLGVVALGMAERADSQEPAAAKQFDQMLASITEKSVEATLHVLAGPSMQGRGTFTPGFDRAADFVSDQLKALGLEPVGVDGGYRLPYSLDCVRPKADCAFSWEGASAEELPALGTGFVPMLGSPARRATGEAVFAGFGIQSKDEKWSDYKEKDVRGKIVFAFTREPWAGDAKQKRFAGADPIADATLTRKVQSAAEAGAIGFVFVPDPGVEADEERAFLAGHTFPSTRGIGARELEGMYAYPQIPVMSVSRKVAGALFGTDLAAYHAEVEKKKKSSLLEAKAPVTLAAGFEVAPTQAYNLAARIRGSSPAPEGEREVLVLGAHLDHVGLGVQQEFGASGVQPFPGADDNASGSTALLEVAAAFAGAQPEIDVLFLWFSAEELGLLGSVAYCEKPLYAHERTVAMLNMDQIARTDPKEFNVGGTWNHDKWADFVQDQAKRAKVKIKVDFKGGRDLFARSDQYSFHAKGVPALFFFEGNINDNPVYHKPGDVPETIEVAKMTQVARVFGACAWAIAVEGVRLR
jgi:hypothetical protein